MTSENLPLVLARTESKRDIVNAAVCDKEHSDALNSRAPDSSQMQPGRVYIGRLPNHSGPVFVRKRRKSFTNPFGVPAITSIFASPERPQIDYQCTNTAVYQPPPPAYMMQAPMQYSQPPQYLPQPADTTTTTVTTTVEPQPSSSSKHSCPSCGKFRSPRYHYRHPLAPGETPRPTLCRRCVKQHTSSEEHDDLERERYKRKKWEARHRRRHRSYSSEDWSSSSSQEERRRHHRSKSANDRRRQRRSAQSSSETSTKIYIIRRPEERRRQHTSSSENVRIIRRVVPSEDLPRPILRSRHRYGPYDGHHSREEYHSDVEIEDDDFFEPRGRSRSRSFSRQSLDDSHSYDEDEYVRVSTTTSRRRPLSFLDRLTGSRSRSSSRNWRARHGEGSVNYEDERVEISIRSREPSPLRYERREHEFEERIEERSPWRRGSDSMLVHHDSAVETRSNDPFGRSQSAYSGHIRNSHRFEGRAIGLRTPEHSVRTLRVHSPEPFSRRRRSLDRGSGHRPRVRFARSTSSHREEHDEPHEPHPRRRQHRYGSNLSFSDEEGFPSAGKDLWLGSRMIVNISKKVDFESTATATFGLRRHRHSHQDDDGFGDLFDRSYLSPPMESRSYVRRRRSHSREYSDSHRGGESYDSRRRVRIIDV
ncbi:MAG: hypothetical protein Q9186_004107 [Xanthomendoza sp. 1 TL-2023]